MAAEKKRSVSGSTYVLRNAPSDIVRGRPSSAPPEGAKGSGDDPKTGAAPLPRPPRVPRPIEEVVERVERFDFAPVTPRASRPPSVPPPSARTPSAPTPSAPTPTAPPRASGIISTPAPPPGDVRSSSAPPTSRAPSTPPASRAPSTPPTSRASSTPPPRPASDARPRSLTVDHVRTDLDALRSPSVVPDAPPPVADPVTALLLELCRAAPGDVDRLGPRLLRESARLLPELARHFPGPAWFDRKLPYRRLPRASEASPLGAALVLLGADSAPHVEALLAHASPDVRFHAALVATELGQPELLAAVAQLLLDADPGVRRAALAAVEALRASPTYPHILEGLRRTASQETVQQVWRVRSVDALADLGDALALDVLVELLGDDDRTIARAAHDGLRRLTCHDLGTMRIAWRRWAKSQGRRHRFDWLVDALADRRPELRRMALQELRRVSGHDFGVTEDAPRSAFVEAQPKFLRWWQARVAT